MSQAASRGLVSCDILLGICAFSEEFGLQLEGAIAMAGLVLFAACSAKRRLTASTRPSVWTGIGKIGPKRTYPAMRLDLYRHFLISGKMLIFAPN